VAAQYRSVGIFFESQSSDLLVHHLQKVAKHRHCQVDSLAAALVRTVAAGHHQSRRSYHHQAQKAAYRQQNRPLEWWLVAVEIAALAAGLALRTCRETVLVRGKAVAEVLVAAAVETEAEAYSPTRRGHTPAAAQKTVLVAAG